MLCSPYSVRLSTTPNKIVTADSDSTLLFNIVRNYRQCGQLNSIQSCYSAGLQFLAMFGIPLLVGAYVKQIVMLSRI